MAAQNTNLTTGVTITDRSSTVTVGGTAQTAIAANIYRRFLFIQNPTTEIENLFVDFGATAVGDGTDLTLVPGAAVLFDVAVPIELISVIAATSGHKFIMKDG
jgi:hypothetical protein